MAHSAEGDTVERSARGRLVVAVALLVLTACSSPGPADPPPEVVSTAPAPTLAPAADGGDLSACTDGVCEVRIDGPTSVPIDSSYSVQNVMVASIADTMVSITAELTRGGSVRTECVGEAASCMQDGMGFRVTESAGGGLPSLWLGGGEQSAAYLPALTIELVDVLDGAVVLRLSHPEAVDGTDLSTCTDGSCAVSISAPASIPLDPALGVRGDLRVDEVSAEIVAVSVVPEGLIEPRIVCGTASDACTGSYDDSGLRASLVRGAELRLPELSVRLSALDDGVAVLSLTAAGG